MSTTKRPPYYGWVVLGAIAGLSFARAVAAIAILGVFIAPMSSQFGWGRTQISGAASVGSIGGALLAPLAGRLTDRFGPRAVLAIAATLVGLATLSLSLVNSLLAFYLLYGLSRGVSQGAVQVATPTAVANWFLRLRGRAMAIMWVSAAAGMVVLPLLLQTWISLWSWRIAWVGLGIVVFLVGVAPSALLIRRRPEDMGLEMDGASRRLPGVGSAYPGRPSPPVALEGDWSLREAVRTSTLWLLLAAFFTMSITNAGTTLHLVPYLTEKGLIAVVAVGAVSVYALSMAAGSLVWGFLAERVSVRMLMVLACLMGAGTMAILLQVDTLPQAYLFSVIFGLALGGYLTLAPVLLANYYGRRSLGSIQGLGISFEVVGVALGALLAGVVYDVTGSYDGVFITFGVLGVLASLLVLRAVQPSRRRQPELG